MSDSIVIYPSISLSCESLHSASVFPVPVFLLRDHQLPHLFSVFLCPLPSALSFLLSRCTASSSCFSLERSYLFLFPSLLKSHSFSPASMSISLRTTCLSCFFFFCLHLPNTSSFSFFVHLSQSASLSSENCCDKLTLELFTCQADD